MERPIRILQMIGSLNIGGSQSMILNLYKSIDKSKVQFDFILDHPLEIYYKDMVENFGAKIYEMPTFTGKNYFQVKKAWNEFFVSHPEYRVLHSHVRSYASIYIPIAKKHGLRTIIHSHSTSNGSGLSSYIKAIMQFPLRWQADYLFACSEKAGRWLFGEKASEKKNFYVISNAIDAQRFEYNETKRLEVREKLDIADKFVIGHVGRFTEPKNHIFLIEVFAEICKMRADAILLLVGDGELKGEIENKILALDIKEKVLLLGNKSNTEDYYQAMDVFMFPSLWEGLGIVAVEAQAAGLICFVSDRIPSEIDLGEGLVKVISLNEKASVWAEQVINGGNVNHNNKKAAVVKAGFDVKSNAQFLQKFYLRISE